VGGVGHDTAQVIPQGGLVAMPLPANPGLPAEFSLPELAMVGVVSGATGAPIRHRDDFEMTPDYNAIVPMNLAVAHRPRSAPGVVAEEHLQGKTAQPGYPDSRGPPSIRP
jgi:hypothetical protein